MGERITDTKQHSGRRGSNFRGFFPICLLMQTSTELAHIHWVTCISLGDGRKAARANYQLDPLPKKHPENQSIHLRTFPRLNICLLHSGNVRVHTHSLPMVVRSSFVSLILAELCSEDSGVSKSTSTMGGSACGRIPLHKAN